MNNKDGALPSGRAFAASPSSPAVSTVSASIPSASEPCTMGVGCDQFGVCYADAHGQPEQCPHFARELEAYAWNWLDGQYTDVALGSHSNDRDYSADEMVDAFMAGHAQAIEARSGETGTGSIRQDESAVRQDAPNTDGEQPGDEK